MSNNRKLFIHGTVVETGFRTEQDLPLVATPYMELILLSIFARANTLYPDVVVCHLLVMSNHIHLILVVEDPETVPLFIGYLKRESAHAVNRLLGRRKRTVWCDGYDSPVILDAAKVVERIVYCYTNPQNADLVKTIEEYPNFSTWDLFLVGGGEIRCRRIPRDSILELPKRAMSFKDQECLAEHLEQQSLEENSIFFNPDAWMSCFPEFQEMDPDLVRNEIIKRVKAEEESLSRKRSKPVLGAHALRLQNIHMVYQSKKYSKRMLCLSSHPSLRIQYIDWFKQECRIAFEVFKHWKLGDWRALLPPGMFTPGGILRANLNPAYLPVG